MLSTGAQGGWRDAASPSFSSRLVMCRVHCSTGTDDKTTEMLELNDWLETG